VPVLALDPSLDTVTALGGRTVTLDADTGELLDGALPTITPTEDGDPDLATMKAWAVDAGGTGPTLGELLRSRRQVP
jgi:hypothetical protein